MGGTTWGRAAADDPATTRETFRPSWDFSHGDLKVSDFSPEYNKDKWYQAALTVQGKVANWDVLYSGGYFGRHVDNASDYSYYAVAYDNPDGINAPSYVTFDAMAKWSVDERFDLQVNVYNLTDKYYYDMMHFAFVVPGAGRSAMLTLNYHN